MTELARHDATPARTFTPTDGYTGPVLADVTCPDGTVYVAVDQGAEVAAVRVLTHDGPDTRTAQAVRDTLITQTAERLVVVVPKPAPTGQPAGGLNVSFGGGRTVINGVVYTGCVTVVNGQVTGGAGQAAVQTGIEVHITLPAGSGTRYRSENGSLRTTGILCAVDAEANNGSVTIETVGRLKVEAGNGSVKAGRVAEWIDAEANNGSVRVDEYAGSACRIRAGNGTVILTASPSASGRLDVRAGNGSIRLYGVRGRTDLDINATAGNGTVHKE